MVGLSIVVVTGPSYHRSDWNRLESEVARLSKHGIPAVGLALVVTGCAGTGDMSSMSSVSPGSETPGSEEELRREYAARPEFRTQYALEQVKAHHAYARGATGEGVTLGIVDRAIDPSHPKFAGKLESSDLEGYEPDFSTCDHHAPDGECISLLGHGMHVGGIMAASRRVDAGGPGGNEAAMHGVAFDARVISVGFPSLEEIIGEPPANPTPEQIREFSERIQNIESILEKQFALAFERLNGKVTAVLDLEPSGRQLDFELVYARPWVGGEAHLAAIASHDARHIRDEHEAALLARYRRTF